MGPITRCKEHILVKIKFECRPVLMSKHHDSLLFMVLYMEALDRLCVRLNMYLVIIIIIKLIFFLLRYKIVLMCTFSAFMLLAVHQEGHLTCKKICCRNPKRLRPLGLVLTWIHSI